MFPWLTPPQPKTPRDIMLQRLREGVPAELAARAAGVMPESLKDDRDVDMAMAEGEIRLFEQARDSGVTGTVRAAMRREASSWMPKAEVTIGLALEDYLKD